MDKKKKYPSALRAGTDFASATIVGTFIGIALDKHFETSPYILLFCIFISFAAAFRMIHKQIF